MSNLVLSYIELAVSEHSYLDPPKVVRSAYVQIYDGRGPLADIVVNKRWEYLSLNQYLRFQRLQNKLANQKTLETINE